MFTYFVLGMEKRDLGKTETDNRVLAEVIKLHLHDLFVNQKKRSDYHRPQNKTDQEENT